MTNPNRTFTVGSLLLAVTVAGVAARLAVIPYVGPVLSGWIVFCAMGAVLRTYAVARRRQLFGMEVNSSDRRILFLNSLAVTSWAGIVSLGMYLTLAMITRGITDALLGRSNHSVFALNFLTPVVALGSAATAYFILRHFWGPPNRDPEDLFTINSLQTDVRIKGELDPDHAEPLRSDSET